MAVEFTGERRKLTAAAQMARKAAAVVASDLHNGDEPDDEFAEGWEASFGDHVGAEVATRQTVAKAAGRAGATSETAEAPPGADLDFEASLAEFEELARSAGAEIAATLIQRRPKPDPATLVGQGKLEEIEGSGGLDGRGTGAVRPRSVAFAAEESGGEAALQGDRPDAADPGYFCAACADAGGSVAGGAGATGVSTAAAGGARQGDEPAGRRHRDDEGRVRRNWRRTGERSICASIM